MRAFLARGPEDQQGSIVLLGEELEGCDIFEWVDGILLGELFGEGNTQLMEITKSVLDNLGAAGATEEEGGFGVLDSFWGFFVEGSFGARIAGFAIC